MMDYEVFKNVITARIKEFLPSIYAEFEVSIERVPKINGMKDAVVVCMDSGDCRMTGPNIYIDDLYRSFAECEDIELILKEAACMIMTFTGTQTLSKSEKFELDQYREEIIKVLINTGLNEGLLELAPHKEFMDLSVTYRMVVEDAEGNGYSTALITNDLLEELGMTVDELDALAEINSRRKLATKVISAGNEMKMMITTGMIFGGINLQRLDEIKKIADELQSDLYLLPSSIHDIMVFSKSVCEDECTLFRLVKEGNKICTGKDEFLSDNIYFYSRTTNE